MPYSGMPDEKRRDAAADPEASVDEIAAALQLDLHDDEFDDLALPDDEPQHEVAAESGDALELDDHELEELDAVVEAPDDEPETLYIEVDGRFTAVEKDRFIIGRVANMCDLAIRDVNVSRQHCAIERRDDGYYAVDLGSINGVLVDGKRTNDHRIEEGDVLVLSGHEIACSFHVPVITAARVEPEPAYPNATGEFPPVPQAAIDPEPEPEVEPEPEPAPHVPTPNYAPVPMAAQPTSFEDRVEQRLDYMMQQLNYLQQSLNALYVRVEQLQGVAALADMIQGRLATKRNR